jgi:hypothetical protein
MRLKTKRHLINYLKFFLLWWFIYFTFTITAGIINDCYGDTYKIGSKGAEVGQIQTQLKALGYQVEVDNVFGPELDTTVKQFQKGKGLDPDGVVGPGTWLILFGKPQDVSIPPRAQEYLPVLKENILDVWPDMPIKSTTGGQVEQETCPSLHSSECWNPHAELKTSREYGFGLGQITAAYDSQGKVIFDNFKWAVSLDQKLKSWKYEDRYNAEYQLRALIRFDQLYWRGVTWAKDDLNHWAFTLSSYNGGDGGVRNDRKLCQSQGGDCDNWFGDNGVAKYSWKSKIKIQGYGDSFYSINRSYVTNVLMMRRQKYISSLE